MEGGSPSQINLSSPLDTSSSDMLVGINQPTFQHNWQKFQGQFLPNSMRMEKNGWAAGWNVYNFEYKTFRKQLSDTLWAQLCKVSDTVAMLYLYDSESAYIPLAQYTFIRASSIISGTGSLNSDGTLTGKLGDKSFIINLSDFTISNGFTLTHKTLPTFYESLLVQDATSYFKLDADIYTVTDLIGDMLSETKFDKLTSNKYTWGNYVYDKSNNELTTPEGIIVTPTLSDTNLLTFDYSASITDETVALMYTLTDYYVKFKQITYKDATNEKMQIGSNPSLALKYDLYTAEVTPKTLTATDVYNATKSATDTSDGSIILDWQLPLWLTFGCNITKVDNNAKKCDNTQKYEIALFNNSPVPIKLKWNNIFGDTYSNTTGNAILSNANSSDSFKFSYFSEITDSVSLERINIPYRFNQILIGNVLSKPDTWSPYKYVFNPNAYFGSTAAWANFVNLNTTLFTLAFGYIYTIKSFKVDLTNYFEYNNPYDFADAENIVYTQKDISKIYSFKLKGAADNIDEGDDVTFLKDNLPLTLANFITQNSTITPTYWSSSDTAVSFTDVYTGNVYALTSYEAVATSEGINDFWPFAFVPKFNLKLNDGSIVSGVYYASKNLDGSISYITDLEQFKSLIRGDFNAVYDMFSYCLPNAVYNRKRNVSMYKPCYDFNYIRKDDYKDDNERYATLVAAEEATWVKYYPDFESPQRAFDDSASFEDTTYLDYIDINIIENAIPQLSYVDPGVYVNNDRAVRYGTATGLIVYEDTNNYTADPFIYHHTVDKLSKYSFKFSDVPGLISWSGGYKQLPHYFGSATVEPVVYGATSNNATVFYKRTQNYKLTSGALEFGFRTSWEYQIVHNDDNTYSYKQTITYDNVNTPDKAGGHDIWLICAHYKYTKNKLQRIVERPYIESDSLSSYRYVSGDASDGFKIAIPFYGHSATKIQYPLMLKKSDVTDKDAFNVSKVASSDLTTTNRIYFDRADIDRSIELFDIKLTGQITAGDANTAGNCIFQLVNADDDTSGLWYAKKQVNTTNKEIFSDYYIPGVAYDDITSTLGNLTFISSNYPLLKLEWTPVIYRMPDSALASYIPKNSKNSTHSFFSTDYQMLNPSAEIGTFDINAKQRQIIVMLNDQSFDVYYDIATQRTVYTHPSITVVNTSAERVDVTGVTSEKAESASILLGITLHYVNNKARIFGTNDATISFVSAEPTTVTMTYYGAEIVYDYVKSKILSPEADLSSKKIALGYHISAEGASESCAYVVAISDVVNGRYSFSYLDEDYEILLSDFDGKSNDVLVTSCDVRAPNKLKYIGKIDADKEYQFLRQQWNTTIEVENFWWIDATHVLELNSENFVLKLKTDELDDWNGNKFTKLWDKQRIDVIDSTVHKYFCTNCYNSQYAAFFVTLKLVNSTIEVKLYDVRKQFTEFSTFYVQLTHHAIGEVLNQQTIINDTLANLNTYNEALRIDFILSKAEWSNTVVDNRLILGIHFSNNFDQWAIVYNLSTETVELCVQGYGFVGLHGDLTGGQIPTDFFTPDIGFNDKVQSFDALKPLKIQDLDNLDAAHAVSSASEIYNIDTKVVGNATRQYYVTATLFGIVSHLTYDNGTFTKQVLPMTNNFTASFMSPSWASALVGDNMVQATAISTLFKFPSTAQAVWQIITKFLGEPFLYSFAPRYSQFQYINMTFGQYAYVHYNSHKEVVENAAQKLDDGINSGVGTAETKSNIIGKTNVQDDPKITSSELVFDKQKFSQKVETDIDLATSLLLVLIMSFGSALQEVPDEKVSANEEINTSTVKDTGQLFVANAAEGTANLLADSIVSKSRMSSALSGTVTGLKSLNMFYSTSDEQHIWAGPGYVEHNFVAQCVAQSSTCLKIRGQSLQLYWALLSLTFLQLNIEQQAIALAIRVVKDTAAYQSNGAVCGTTFGPAVAVALELSVQSMELNLKLQQKTEEALREILGALVPDELTCKSDANIKATGLNLEGQHSYGEKSEAFMWPCWGIQPNTLKYNDEHVEAGVKNTPWQLKLVSRQAFKARAMNYITLVPLVYDIPDFSSAKGQLSDFYNIGYPSILTDRDDPMSHDSCVLRAAALEGSVPYYQSACFGKTVQRYLPDDMAKIEGVQSFLPTQAFKNQNISCSSPAFSPSLFQDYVIDKNWDLGMCCTYANTLWLCVKDTKIINCAPSNIFITASFCGVATPYTAIEVKRGLSKAYMRPYAITPNTLALNCTGYNAILDNVLYHAFDGTSYRLVNWEGAPIMNINLSTYFYSFQKNDRFKRSNIMPAEQFLGNFDGEPTQALDTIDELFTLTTIAAKSKGMEGGTISEDKDAVRWALPVFTEPITTLPAAAKTLTAMPLNVFDGVTSLTTILANNQTAYKAPLSVDFTIGKNVYRQTEEYISSVHTQDTLDLVDDIIPSLGLTFIGSTPTEAYFYSKATRHYYIFTGSNLGKMSMLERFRDVQKGYWDFIEQQIVMPCLMTYKRLNEEISDKDTETDNIIVPILSDGRFSGELPPPLTTIFNDDSWYKCYSLPCGFTYQGPNRCIVNRSVFTEYMLETTKANLGKWGKLNREVYGFKRDYPEQFETVAKDITDGIDGWTYNPFLLVTSALGNDESTDNIYEWIITFCWPIEMDLIYGVDDYAVVNIMAETMSPGGRMCSRPTHVFLTKELFTRSGNYGYYSFRYQSKNGAGNRERLKIWSDQYIAISSLVCESKSVTSRRTEILTQQVDVQKLHEL